MVEDIFVAILILSGCNDKHSSLEFSGKPLFLMVLETKVGGQGTAHQCLVRLLSWLIDGLFVHWSTSSTMGFHFHVHIQIQLPYKGPTAKHHHSRALHRNLQDMHLARSYLTLILSFP